MTETLLADHPDAARHMYHLEQIGAAGWESAGGVWLAPGCYDINEGSVLPRFVRDLDDKELAMRLGLAGGNGDPAPGYEIGTDVEGVFLGYEGPLSAHYLATLSMMARLARPATDPEDPGADVLSDPVEIQAYRETYEALMSDRLNEQG